ncbi:Signal transduction histidine kinase [Flaviramulus basaltis]|uniref:histidine kinase n=1 Tax=Flaviramulus basaltis TaxID=369401 RepID=A0A1K2ITH8_9FLAO|nr:two-component regulator propeller domain-containing protein [Flaviramulus basaltis]SFZ95027.1 Signal transduction histidine kinase [Flaviramulus basaltis]
MNFMKYINTYILIFFISVYSNAQKTDLRFETIDYDENFPQSTISKIIQGKKGFIWLGTENGLVRYDGYNFIRYYTSNKEEGIISNNHINDIYEDLDGNLWIGTSHGVNLYNRNTNDFKIIDLPPVNPIKGGRNYISSFIEDDNKNLWVGTFGGVKKLNKETHLLEDIFTETNLFLSSCKVYTLFYDNELGILVSTNSGLQSFDPTTSLNKELPELITENISFFKEKILKIIKEVNGDMWFATESAGVFLYSKNQNKFVNYRVDLKNKNSISSNNVKDILYVDNNTLWFATDDGLNVFDKDKKQFTRHQHNPLISSTISDNNIRTFLKDREGSIWLGTKTGSINFFNKANSNFTNVGESIYQNFGLNNTIINAIIDDDNESLWVGTNGGGLNYLDFKNRKKEYYLIESFKGQNIITSLVNKNKETLLCGTLFGLYQFNKKAKKFSKLSIFQEEVQVSSLLVDDEDIWVGTDGTGLVKISKNGDIENYQKKESGNSISDNFITHIENRKNGLWVSTQFGLNFFNKKTKKFITILQGNEANSLSNNTLSTLFIDSKDRLWVGMGYGGLNYFDEKTKKFYLINEAMGLTDGDIKSISEDSQGNLWVSSNNLLFQIKIKDLIIPLKKSNFEIISYGPKDGITVKNYSNNCSVIFEDEMLAFGGTKGLIIFNPNNIIKPKATSKIVLTKLIINNEEVKFSDNNSILEKDISEAPEITLNYNQKFIGFQFSSLNFINTENNKYAYKLESTFEDDSWHDIGTQNRVNLAALNSGTYFFKLKSLNDLDNLNVKSLKITILPPWWKTNWAYLAYTILIVSIFIITMNFIKSKVIIKQALLLKQTESARREELYNMKLDFFTNISHEIRTPLTLIQGPVEELLSSYKEDSKLKKKLTTIKKNSDRLLTLINELLDFRKIESKQMKIFCEKQDIIQFCFDIYESFKGLSERKNIDYKFVMNTKSIPVFFDKHQMEKVIYNLLSNAFKFTKKNGKIVISIEEIPDDNCWIQIKIKDNGIGIPKDSKKKVFKGFFQVDERGQKNTGSGIGLALSKTIVELHHGELNIENEPETWATTVFKISLQKGRAHLNESQIVENDLEFTELKSNVEIVEKELLVPEQIIEDEELEDENKLHVLIIDDHKEIRKFIKEILQEEYTIIAFSNGQDAINYMEKQIPDLIICDVMMPEMDGFEFCKRIKTHENTNHIPVILLTAKTSTENRIDGLSLGADAYITKPFSVKVLKLNIINLLSSKEILRQKYSGSFIIDSNLEKLEMPEEMFIKKLMKIIEQNIEKPDFDVNELVKEIGMSRTVLYKKVKALTNHSVASLIKHLRLKKAADILLNTNYHISEVTYLVGFSDRKHFSKEFKKIFKVSPTEYRKAVEKQL